jgi:hypothetical protein
MKNKDKIKMTLKQWSAINFALACAKTMAGQPHNKKYHPEWSDEAEKAIKVLISECFITEGGEL